MGYWGEGHMDDGWGPAMVLVMLAIGLLIVVVAGLAVLLVRRAGAPSSVTRGGVSDAEQILAHRMARGEIDTEEFRDRLDVLRAGGLR